MTFPISALALAERAAERLDEQIATVQQQMVGAYLPQTVEVILSRQADCRAIVKKLDSSSLDRLVGNLGQVLWSHPGSMGGHKIEQQLIAAGFNHEEADTLATNIIRYSRYSMSIVNSIRHYKSAISGVRDLIDPINFRERYLGFATLPEEATSRWLAQSEDFGQAVLKDSGDLSEWLTRVEAFIAEVNTASNWARRRVLQDQDPNGWRNPSLANVSIAKAYTRRYGRYLMQEFKDIHLGGRYIPINRSQNESVLDELYELKKKLSSDDKAIFLAFSDDYESRSHRITSHTKQSSRTPFARNTSDFSYFENYISNQFKLDGRDLVVKSKPERISKALIEQMYRVFKVQIEMEPNMDRFISKTDRDGESLLVELEKPAKSDGAKLKKLLTNLLSD